MFDKNDKQLKTVRTIILVCAIIFAVLGVIGGIIVCVGGGILLGILLLLVHRGQRMFEARILVPVKTRDTVFASGASIYIPFIDNNIFSYHRFIFNVVTTTCKMMVRRSRNAIHKQDDDKFLHLVVI